VELYGYKNDLHNLKGDDLMSYNILIPIIIMGLIILCGFGIFKVAKIMKR
jgi:hypothetical protein